MNLRPEPSTSIFCCRAKQTFDTEVLPVFRAAGLEVLQHVTEYAGHATDLMAELDLTGIQVLAVVGGDGTMFEALAVLPYS